jgi:hypothetical protein
MDSEWQPALFGSESAAWAHANLNPGNRADHRRRSRARRSHRDLYREHRSHHAASRRRQQVLGGFACRLASQNCNCRRKRSYSPESNIPSYGWLVCCARGANADIVIIGGGVIGLSQALELAHRDLDLTDGAASLPGLGK